MAIGFPVKANYATGDVLTATNMNDLSGTVNTLQGISGRNPVLNSAFQVWQRGTSVSIAASSTGYTADRWGANTGANGASTISRQVTGDTTNLANIQYCARVQKNAGQTGTAGFAFYQSFESINAIPFAGKTVTLSFYARKGANYSQASSQLTTQLLSGTGTDQNILSGYTGLAIPLQSNVTLTTTWQRFSVTGTIASTATEFAVGFEYTPVGTAGAADYYEVTGIQLEVGSTATPFNTYAGTIQGELAACQRYYWRPSGQSNYAYYGSGVGEAGGNVASILLPTPVNLRSPSTASVDFSTLAIGDASGTLRAVTSANINHYQSNCVQLLAYVASGLTQYRPAFLLNNNSTSAYIAISSEL